jgi:hypothetical protein
MLQLSNTTQLLLYCVQLNATGRVRDEIEALVRQHIDWKAFEGAAVWHGVAPLAYNGLRSVRARHRLPANLFDMLKSEYRNNLIRNTLLFAELKKILSILNAQHVPVVPLKGAHITQMIYKDIGLRPMSDIDILVKREDIRRAVQAIEACGFRRHDRLSLDQLLQKAYHATFINPDNTILLEVHWRVTLDHHPSRIRSKVSNLMDDWWSRASNQGTGFDHVFHLHPIDLICLLSIHFFKHRLSEKRKCFSSRGSLLQLCDILNVVSFYQDSVTRDELDVELRKMGLSRIVGVAFEVVKTLFTGIMVDGTDFFDNLNIAHADKEVALYVAKRVCSMKDRHVRVPYQLIRAQHASPRKGRIASLCKAVFPDPQTLSARLNRPITSNWFYLNYFFRVFSLITDYGKTGLMQRHLKEEGVLRRWIDGIE